MHKCSFCGETDPSKFYGRKRTRCGKCHNKDTIRRYTANKAFAVELLGGKCQHCGYCKSHRALQFHHLNPAIKDRNFSGSNGWSKERIRKELANCILLCANCHLEEHERLDKNRV